MVTKRRLTLTVVFAVVVAVHFTFVESQDYNYGTPPPGSVGYPPPSVSEQSSGIPNRNILYSLNRTSFLPNSSTPISAPPPTTTSTAPPPPETPDTPPPPYGDSPPASLDDTSISPTSSEQNGPAPASPEIPKKKRHVLSTAAIAGIAAGGGAFLLIVVGLLLFILLRNRRPEPAPQPPPAGGYQNPNVQPPPQVPPYGEPRTKKEINSSEQYGTPPPAYYPVDITHPPSNPQPGVYTNNSISYEELKRATNGFSKESIIGRGGFGLVYRGVLSSGMEVAVKQLSPDSWQGEREFQAEIDTISHVNHRHLVSLVGYCVTDKNMLLVYRYVPNGTLESRLHGGDQPTLDWATRMKVAVGSAKGLAYLHEDCRPKIIHRDIKTANILLDIEFEAQVADFGLAKFFSDTKTQVTTRVVGSFGYLAPEYAASGKLTEKSDVFSFGVILLELITGRRPTDKGLLFENDNMVDWAMPLLVQALVDENYETVVDKRLEDNYNKDEMKRMVACAAACIRHSGRHRPKMSQVVRMLEGEVSIDDLNQGLRPGQTSYYGSSGNSAYSSSGQHNAVKRRPQTTKEDTTSSEYSESTGDYSSYPTGSSSEV